MTTESMVERTWTEDMDQLHYHLDPFTRKITRRLEEMNLKIIVFHRLEKKNMFE